MNETQVRQLEQLRQDAVKAGDKQKAAEYADKIELDAIWREMKEYDPVVF